MCATRRILPGLALLSYKGVERLDKVCVLVTAGGTCVAAAVVAVEAEPLLGLYHHSSTLTTLESVLAAGHGSEDVKAVAGAQD